MHINSSNNKKICIITPFLSPYRVVLFNSIYELSSFNLKVIGLTEMGENRQWQINKDKIKFNYQVLPGIHSFIQNKEIPIYLNRGVFRVLRQYNPDIVIASGYNALPYWQAFLYCKFFKKKYILWNETTLLSAGSTKGMRGLLKKIITKGADKYIAPGTKAKEYLEYFGAKPENIYISTNTVDMNYFRSKVFHYREKKNFFRERKKYPKILLLYVGQLIKRKGIKSVLETLAVLKDPEIGFLIVGNGPEEEKLKAFCTDKKLKNIFFEGFYQQEELFKYYALADVFILPSLKEVWGMVVNEALSSGLYVLCSKYVGATYDLIDKDKNGDIFDPNNLKGLIMLMQKTKKRIATIREWRSFISEQTSNKFSIKKSAQVFIEVIKQYK